MSLQVQRRRFCPRGKPFDKRGSHRVRQGGPGTACKWPCHSVFGVSAPHARLAPPPLTCGRQGIREGARAGDCGGTHHGRESGSVSLLPCCSLSIAGCCQRVSSPSGDNCSHPSRHPGQATHGGRPVATFKRIDAYNEQYVKNRRGCRLCAWRYRADRTHRHPRRPTTLNIRGSPSTTDAADGAPNMPDALETACALHDALPQPLAAFDRSSSSI